jgi:hypothetical protein
VIRGHCSGEVCTRAMGLAIEWGRSLDGHQAVQSKLITVSRPLSRFLPRSGVHHCRFWAGRRRVDDARSRAAIADRLSGMAERCCLGGAAIRWPRSAQGRALAECGEARRWPGRRRRWRAGGGPPMRFRRSWRQRLLVEACQRPALCPRKNSVPLLVAERPGKDLAQEVGDAQAHVIRKKSGRRNG